MNRYEIEQEIKKYVEKNGMELVDIDVSRKNNPHIQIYIWKEDGISVDDCQLISREIDQKVPLDDYFPDKYNLEVSSPGLDRKLVNKDDYRRNIGNDIELRTYAAVDGSQEFYGILKDFDEENLYISVEEKDIEIPITNVSLLRQNIVF